MIPDPTARATFEASVLRWEERHEPEHAAMLAWYTRLLHLRATEIAPHVAHLHGTSAGFERLGPRGLRLRWRLPGSVLHADAQLGDEAGRGFAEMPEGTTLFATHDVQYPGGAAPPWSVRWSRT